MFGILKFMIVDLFNWLLYNRSLKAKATLVEIFDFWLFMYL